MRLRRELAEELQLGSGPSPIQPASRDDEQPVDRLVDRLADPTLEIRRVGDLFLVEPRLEPDDAQPIRQLADELRVLGRVVAVTDVHALGGHGVASGRSRLSPCNCLGLPIADSGLRIHRPLMLPALNSFAIRNSSSVID
jgi:hypothetical protein